MALSKRERFIGIGVGCAVGLFLLDRVAIGPYFEYRSNLLEDITKEQDVKNKAAATFRQQRELKPVLAELRKQGLSNTASVAADQMLRALNDWIQESGLKLESLNPEGVKPDKGFQEIGARAMVSGTTAALAKLMWRIESAPMPVRVYDVQLRSHTEGQDDLQIQVSVAILVEAPPEKPAGGRSVSLVEAKG